MSFFGFSYTWKDLMEDHQRFVLEYGSYSNPRKRVDMKTLHLLKKMLKHALYIKMERKHISDADLKQVDLIIEGIKGLGVTI